MDILEYAPPGSGLVPVSFATSLESSARAGVFFIRRWLYSSSAIGSNSRDLEPSVPVGMASISNIRGRPGASLHFWAWRRNGFRSQPSVCEERSSAL